MKSESYISYSGRTDLSITKVVEPSLKLILLPPLIFVKKLVLPTTELSAGSWGTVPGVLLTYVFKEGAPVAGSAE